jgi:hypothetical protein
MGIWAPIFCSVQGSCSAAVPPVLVALPELVRQRRRELDRGDLQARTGDDFNKLNFGNKADNFSSYNYRKNFVPNI